MNQCTHNYIALQGIAYGQGAVAALHSRLAQAMFSDRIIEASRMTTDQTTNRD